jgi:hypothetical protein
MMITMMKSPKIKNIIYINVGSNLFQFRDYVSASLQRLISYNFYLKILVCNLCYGNFCLFVPKEAVYL